MKMCLAFLHGESIVFGIFLVGVLFWPTAIALFVWKWRYLTQHSWRVIFCYLLLVAVSSLPLLSYDSDFFGFILGTAFTLPWALFVPQLLGVVGNPALAASLFLCGAINSALFYFASYLLRGRRTRNPAGQQIVGPERR
jgi:hypothetical protein